MNTRVIRQWVLNNLVFKPYLSFGGPNHVGLMRELHVPVGTGSSGFKHFIHWKLVENYLTIM